MAVNRELGRKGTYSSGDYAHLNQIEDELTRNAVRRVSDLLVQLRQEHDKTVGTVTKPLMVDLNSNDRRLTKLADPADPQDAVTLQYLQMYVKTAINNNNTANAQAEPGTPGSNPTATVPPPPGSAPPPTRHTPTSGGGSGSGDGGTGDGGDGPPDGTVPTTPMSADSATAEDQVKRSLAYAGHTDWSYWQTVINWPSMKPWQGGDGNWYIGWDAYFEARMITGDAAASHALYPLPAVHQNPVPAGYPVGGWT